MKRQIQVRVAGWVLFLMGSAVMAGWMLELSFWPLSSLSGTVMVFQTGMCFALAGIGLAVRQTFPGQARAARIVVGYTMVTIALLALTENIFSIDLGIDLASLHRWYFDANPHPGRMAPNAAICFLLSGTAFLLKPGDKRLGPFYHAMSAIVATLGLGGLAAYTSLLDLAYSWYDIPRMAFTTATGMIVLGTALMADRREASSLVGQVDASITSTAAEDARIYAFLGMAATVLAMVFFVAYGSIRDLMDRAAWVEHTSEVRTEFGTMMAVDTRAYYSWRISLVTGDRESVNEANAASTEMSQHMARLQALTADNPEQRQRLVEMQKLAAANNTLLVGDSATPSQKPDDSQEAVLSSNRQTLHSIAEKFRDEEDRLLARRQEASRTSVATTIIVIIVGTVLGFAILFYATWLLRRQNELRDRLADTIQRSNSFLDSLIEHIPNMVFVKDAAHLRFVRFNKAGEELLGFARTEMLGKNDYDFFPREEADFFTAKDRAVLTGRTVADIAEEPIHTREKGTRILHTKKIPVCDAQGNTQYLLGISEDITERIRAEREIVTLNASLKMRATELEESNKELESFTYSVSHDLRAPLRAINGYALMLEEDYHDGLDEEGKRYIAQIRGYSTQMGSLIDDLLHFSRLGRQAIVAIPLDMNKLVKEIVHSECGDTSTAKIVISDLPMAPADPILLRQVWVNLLSNALKYSSKKAQPLIEISGYRDDRQVVYCVKDNGCGFNMTYYAKLFSVFQRLHRADEFPGTGVGLAIVQRVVSRHGGRVWATSEVDKGAEFRFSLPLDNPTG